MCEEMPMLGWGSYIIHGQLQAKPNQDNIGSILNYTVTVHIKELMK